MPRKWPVSHKEQFTDDHIIPRLLYARKESKNENMTDCES